MNKKIIIWIIVIAVVLGGIWLWVSTSGNKAPAAQESVSPSIGTVESPTLGTYLVAANGMTLYHFTKDAPGVSNCSGVCETNWPPYITASAASLTGGTGITGMLGSITRADGTLQVTYNGSPLYFWSKDLKPGDATGQGFGGVWFVVNP